jgi:glycerol-3-phosphate dehydrogenase (NAD(P)+)
VSTETSRMAGPNRRSAVAVLGAGGWGTALAILAASNGRDVRLWARREEFAAELAAKRVNSLYLAGVRIPDEVRVTGDLGETMEGAGLVIIAAPSHGFRDIVRRAACVMRSEDVRRAVFVSAAKGLETGSRERMSRVLAQEAPDCAGVAVVSGPNFALEVARGLPAATVIASTDRAAGEAVQDVLMGPAFRAYTSPDVIGVEIAGALKNVYAIATGLADGLGLGQNARAAVMTRGLAEMTRLGVALGAHPLTFAGLAGVGDLLLTCTGDLSRNRRAGLAIGRGERPSDHLAATPMAVEGVRTAAVARDLSAQFGVDMPIVEQVYAILFAGKPAADAVRDLMVRMRRAEGDGLDEHAATW